MRVMSYSSSDGGARSDGGGGYVKLVAPGGKAFQVRGPVRAGDVMHSTQLYVTRPDIFRVSPPHSALLTPGAILMPGDKFYLLPQDTLLSLLTGKPQVSNQEIGAAPSVRRVRWREPLAEFIIDHHQNTEEYSSLNSLSHLLKDATGLPDDLQQFVHKISSGD